MTTPELDVDYHRVPLGDVVDICTDQTHGKPRWAVGVGPLTGTKPPYVAVTLATPRHRGRSAGTESFGRIDPVFRLACFGTTLAQAEWLRQQIVEADWPREWHPAEPAFPAPVLDDTAGNPWWISTVFMTVEPC